MGVAGTGGIGGMVRAGHRLLAGGGFVAARPPERRVRHGHWRASGGLAPWLLAGPLDPDDLVDDFLALIDAIFPMPRSTWSATTTAPSSPTRPWPAHPTDSAELYRCPALTPHSCAATPDAPEARRRPSAPGTTPSRSARPRSHTSFGAQVVDTVFTRPVLRRPPKPRERHRAPTRGPRSGHFRGARIGHWLRITSSQSPDNQALSVTAGHPAAASARSLRPCAKRSTTTALI